MFRRFARFFALLSTVMLYGCHGGGGTPFAGNDPLLAPTGLEYGAAQIAYPVNEPIVPNEPRSSGGAITAYAVAPDLPAGLTLNGQTGVISGTPTVLSNPRNYTVTGSNEYGAVKTVLRISITQFVTAPTSLNYAHPSAVYTAGVKIEENYPHPEGGEITGYSVQPPLPDGLQLSSTTGVISGTPNNDAADGIARTYTVTGKNDAGSVDEPLQITVEQAMVPPLPPPPAEPPTDLAYAQPWAVYTNGKAILPNVAHHGGGPIVSYSVVPSLPAGLTLDPITGDIEGEPQAVVALQTYTITGAGVDGAGPAKAKVSIQVVDPDTWVPTPGQMSVPRYSTVQVTLADGRVLVAGGLDGAGDTLDSAELYDPDTGEWSSAGTMPGGGRYSAMIALLPSVACPATAIVSCTGPTTPSTAGGKVLIFGGYDATGAVLSTAVLFDPSAGSGAGAWQSTASMLAPRVGAAVTVLSNGKVLAAGGATNTALNLSTEMYDPVGGTWAYGKPLYRRVADTAAVSLENSAQSAAQVLIPGGRGDLGALGLGQWTTNPGTANWTNGNLAGQARFLSGVIAVTPSVALLLGGNNGGAALQDVDYFSADTLSFSSLPSLSVPRSAPLVAPLDGNRVLVAGGLNGLAGGVGVDSAELYTFDPANPSASTDKPAAPMKFVRAGAGISALQDGHVLVAGGSDNTSSTTQYWKSSELYVP